MKNLINRLLLGFNLQLVNTADIPTTPLEEMRERNKELLRKVSRLQALVYYYRNNYRNAKGLAKQRKKRDGEEIISLSA